MRYGRISIQILKGLINLKVKRDFESFTALKSLMGKKGSIFEVFKENFCSEVHKLNKNVLLVYVRCI